MNCSGGKVGGYEENASHKAFGFCDIFFLSESFYFPRMAQCQREMKEIVSIDHCRLGRDGTGKERKGREGKGRRAEQRGEKGFEKRSKGERERGRGERPRTSTREQSRHYSNVFITLPDYLLTVSSFNFIIFLFCV